MTTLNDGGWYYLHTNGELIHKRFDPSEDASDFVRRVWHVDITDRRCAWRIVLEALAMGSNKPRMRELARKWEITPVDLWNYLSREDDVTDERRQGLELLAEDIWDVSYDDLMKEIEATKQGQEPDMSAFKEAST